MRMTTRDIFNKRIAKGSKRRLLMYCAISKLNYNISLHETLGEPRLHSEFF